jgi:hypothetical protein
VRPADWERYLFAGDERNRRRVMEGAEDGLESETTLLGHRPQTRCAESTGLSYERPRFHRANGEGLRLGSGRLGFFVPHSG